MVTPVPGVAYTYNHRTRAWEAPGRVSLPAGTSTPTYVDPDAVAGSLPVGQASYPLPAGALYVNAATGNDTTGTGAIGAPFATFAKAASVVSVNGTIVLRGGEYHEGRTGTDTAGYTGIQVTTAGVTIQNYPGEAVWFTGASRVTGWTAGAGYWSKAFTTTLNRSPTFSFNAADDTRPGWQFVGTQNPYANYAEQVWLDGEPLTYVNSIAELGPGKFTVTGSLSGFDFTATTYYIGDDPAGRDVYIGDLQSCLSLLAAGCTLRGVGVRWYSNSVAHVGAVKGLRDSCGFENVHVKDCVSIGISTTGAGTSSAPIGVNQFLRNCTVYRCGIINIHANRANNLSHYRVRSTHGNWRLFNRAPASGCCKVTRQRGFTARESVYSDSFSHGIWFDEMVVGVDMVTCNIQRNATIGFITELGGNVRLVNVVATHNGADGIASIDTTNFEVWNTNATLNGLNRGLTICGTTITQVKDIRIDADTRIPVTSATTTRDSRYPVPDPDGITWELTKNILKNCIVGLTNVNGLWWIDDKRRNSGLAKAWTTMGVASDGNVYCRPVGPSDTLTGTIQTAWMLPNAGSANGTGYGASFATWKAVTGLDANSTLYDGVTVITAAGLLDPAYQAACDAKAVPLPVDIATLASADAGVLRAGAWR
jgi:hypothetical protein